MVYVFLKIYCYTKIQRANQKKISLIDGLSQRSVDPLSALISISMIFLSPTQSAKYTAIIILIPIFLAAFNRLIRVLFFCDLKPGKFVKDHSIEQLFQPGKNRTRIIPID